MGSEYSGDPSTTDKDAVRFLIGDTDSTDWIFSDEEIDYLIAQEGNVYKACGEACRTAAAKFSREVETVFGALMKAKLHQKHFHYLSLARKFEKKAAMSDLSPWAGGISKADKRARESNSDRVEPAFTRELHDFRGSAVSSETDEGWADPT